MRQQCELTRLLSFAALHVAGLPSVAGKKQRLAAAADAAGELAILLDSIEALLQHSCVLTAAQEPATGAGPSSAERRNPVRAGETSPAGAQVPDSGMPQAQHHVSDASMPYPPEQEQTGQGAAYEALGGLETRADSGGAEEAPNPRKPATSCGIYGTAAQRVADGLRWGMQALHAAVAQGAATTAI